MGIGGGRAGKGEGEKAYGDADDVLASICVDGFFQDSEFLIETSIVVVGAKVYPD